MAQINLFCVSTATTSLGYWDLPTKLHQPLSTLCMIIKEAVEERCVGDLLRDALIEPSTINNDRSEASKPKSYTEWQVAPMSNEQNH